MMQNRSYRAIDRKSALAEALFPRLNCHTYLTDSRYRADIDALIAGGVGGFVLFEGSIDDCARAVGEVRDAARNDLLMAADCEFGAAMRFTGGLAFPSMRAIGECDDVDATEEAAFLVANELVEIGIDWNLAPVVDVNSNPRNPIISIRSFGVEPLHVSRHVRAYIAGMRRGGILTCAKHFPGHGDTAVDSHIAMPLLEKSRGELEDCELIPFKAAIAEGVDSVMTAHLRVPSLESQQLPSSLSASTIDLLRRDLGFDGVVITDALDMMGLVDGYGAVDGVVQAFRAGNDILEVPADGFDALNGLNRAFDEGSITSQQIDESAHRRHLLRKRRDGLRRSRTARTEYLARSAALSIDIAHRAVRIEADGSNDITAIDCIIVADPHEERLVDRCRSECVEAGLNVLGAVVSVSDGARMKRTIESLRDNGALRHLAFIVSATPRGGSTSSVATLLDALISDIPAHRRIICTLGSPDIAIGTPAAVRVDTFSATNESIVELAAVLKEMTLKGSVDPTH